MQTLKGSKLIPSAWFWRQGGAKNMYGTSSHNLGSKTKNDQQWVLPKKKKKWQMPIRLTSYSLPEGHKFNQYDASGRKIPKKKKDLNAFEKLKLEKHKDLEKAMKAKKEQRVSFGQSNAAMLKVSAPEAFDENLVRRGAGMERVTVKLPHSYLATIGMDLPKYASSIDGIETKGKFVCFYITIKPGESEKLRKNILKGTRGSGSVATSSTKNIRKFQLSPPTLILNHWRKLNFPYMLHHFAMIWLRKRKAKGVPPMRIRFSVNPVSRARLYRRLQLCCKGGYGTPVGMQICAHICSDAIITRLARHYFIFLHKVE